MSFDWTINVGHLLTLFGFGCAMLSAFHILKSDIRAVDIRLSVAETYLRDQIIMNAKIIAEVGAVRQDVAVIRDRLEPPPISAQTPSRGSNT